MDSFSRKHGAPREDERAEALSELVFECLERMERDGDGALDSVCREHPELADALRARIETLRQTGLLGESAGRDEPFPERLGDFRLIERLGGGGMGVVYVAEQVSLGRRVALKLIRPEHLYFPGSRERFRREVEAAARLAHPGIVPVYTVGEESGVPYFAMERVEGISLADALHALRGREPAKLDASDLARVLVERGSAPRASEPAARLFEGSWAEACLRIAREVALALDHAHQRGVLHRDVKPSNVMLTASGRVLLLDFGLATSQGASGITRTGAQLGSLPYMAPEQIHARSEELGPGTDVYGLGVTLYELLALAPPYASDSAVELQRRILEARPDSLRRRNPALSVDAETVCLTAMDPDPRRRYASAAELARDLGNVLELRPIDARRSGPLRRAVRWTQRKPAAAAALALAALVVIGAPLGFGVQQKLAKERLDTERIRAERNFDRAFEALGLLTNVSEQRLAQVPEAEEARRELLEGALGFYRGLLEQEGDRSGLRLQVARAHARVGRIQSELGHFVESEQESRRGIDELQAICAANPRSEALRDLAFAYEWLAMARDAQANSPGADEMNQRAIELWERVVREFGGRDEDRLHLAIAHTSLAEDWLERGRREAAEPELVASLELLSPLGERFPGLVEYALPLAWTLTELGKLRTEQGRTAEAEPYLLHARELVEGMRRDLPKTVRIQEQHFNVLAALGRLRAATQRPDDAEEAFTQALDIGRSLVDRFPSTPKHVTRLVELELNLCKLHLDARDLERTEPLAVSAESHMEGLVRSFPDVPGYVGKLGIAQYSRGIVTGMKGDARGAVEILERASRNLAAAVEARHEDADFEVNLRFARLNEALLLVRLGEHERAAEVLAALSEPKAWPDARNSAIALAQCAALARKDAALEPAQAEAIAGGYVERALAVLARAVEGGFADAAELRQGAAWASLRKEPGFAALLERVDGSTR